MSTDSNSITRKQNALGLFVMQNKGSLSTEEHDGKYSIFVKVDKAAVSSTDTSHEAALDFVAEQLHEILESRKKTVQSCSPKPGVPFKLAVYVAGGWAFRHKVKSVMDELRGNSLFRVISGWVERENGANSPDDLADDALHDIDEVTEAEVVLAVMDDPKYAYRGTFTEIGCALGQKKPVMILCPGTSEKKDDGSYSYSHYCQTNVFYHHKLVKHVSTVEEAVAELVKMW